MTESARYASLILPDHTYLERWQDAPAPSSLPYAVWGMVRPVVPPLHDTRATGHGTRDVRRVMSAPSHPTRSQPPEVVFYTGCNLLKTPHIGLLCLDTLDRLGVDPSVASSVFVHTLTDLCGFFLLLGLASRLLL